ncbi:hypothetical protein [Porphyromonas sp.]
MILFVFEGEKREPRLLKDIESCFDLGKKRIRCSYRNQIQSLYSKLKELRLAGIEGGGVDLVALLKQLHKKRKKGEGDEEDEEDEIFTIESSDDVSEVYLFFDLDLQDDTYPLEDQLKHVADLLEYFDDETTNGKLYISYPMIEAIFYTKELPDPDFGSYTVEIKDCKGFKDRTNKFTGYGSFRFTDPKDSPETLRKCWSDLVAQHVDKARALTELPEGKPSPRDIFIAERDEHIRPKSELSILASLPLFLYDYFGEKKFPTKGQSDAPTT